MGRLVVVTIVSFGLRLFSAPSLCVHHDIYGNQKESVAQVMAMSHCHMASMKKAPACRHMKECLLENGDNESVYQKTSGIDLSGYVAYALAFNEPDLFSSDKKVESRGYWQPPPEVFNDRPSVYISKSSFLI